MKYFLSRWKADGFTTLEAERLKATLQGKQMDQVLGGARGQATDIEIHARDILRTKEQMNRILAERTGQPLEKIRADTERDYFLTADEAKDYGLVDQVISQRA